MKDLDFSNLGSVLSALEEVQGAEKDMREQCREQEHFVTKKNGQWEPNVWNAMDGRFRGTFDMCSPIIDSVVGEIEQSDFTLRVAPAAGQASEENAEVLDGLIRNIRNVSNAEHLFNMAGRRTVTCGFDAFEVVQDWIDADAFDQDLFIKRIPNAIDNVWIDGGSVEQNANDAKWAIVLTALTKDDYDERFPDGSGMSVGDSRYTNAYWQKQDKINVGRIVYKKPVTIELVLLSDGSIYNKEDENYLKIQDELLESGVTVIKERKRQSFKVHSRMFDGKEWLTDDEKTVFKDLPVVPVYGNFDIIEDKRVYFGVILKLLDPQRALNYATSRDIEDGALSPSPTVWMTKEMGKGNDYSRMNIDRKGVRFFNTDPQNPGLTPQYTGGPQSSPGLQTTMANMQDMISRSSNFFGAQLGNAPGMQSGVAGAQQIDQGNLTSTKWFSSLKVAICQIGKVVVNAIPSVYDTTQQKRILFEDGNTKMVTLNDEYFDNDTQQWVSVNDLSVGDYDVVCEVGPAFNNQQKETADKFLEMSAVVPGMAELGSDIWVGNLKTPGMDALADRLRKIQLQNGNIPEDQWTDEERAEIQAQQEAAANQPPQEDPMMVAARAEELKAQSDMVNAQTKQQIEMANVQNKQAELQLEMAKLQLQQQQFEREGNAKFNLEAAKIDQGQQKIDLQAQAQQMKFVMDSQQQIVQALNTQADTLNKLREAMGADAIVGEGNTKAYAEQAEIVQESQDKI